MLTIPLKPISGALLLMAGASAALLLAATLNFGAVEAGASVSESGNSPLREWEILKGSSLRHSLEAWSGAAGWTLAWDSPTDFALGASATFTGTYEEAVGGLLNAIHPTVPEIAATLYRGNNVLYVSATISASAR